MAKTQAKKKTVARKPVKVSKPKKAARAAKAAKPKAVAKLAKKAAKPARPAKGKSFHYVHPTRKLEVSKAAGSGDALKIAKEIDKRVAGYERDLVKARKTLEKLTQSVQKSAQPADKLERGPRRFRTGVVKIRDVQREMTDTTTQMRILAGRRAELLWLRTMLTGEKPQMQMPLGPSQPAEAAAPAESGPRPE